MFLTHNFSSKNVCVTVFIHEIKKGIISTKIMNLWLEITRKVL